MSAPVSKTITSIVSRSRQRAGNRRLYTDSNGAVRTSISSVRVLIAA